MDKLFNIGDLIYGFCNGYFGRDDYDDKICILVNSRYAVFQYIDGEMEGQATVLNYRDSITKENVDNWKIKEDNSW